MTGWGWAGLAGVHKSAMDHSHTEDNTPGEGCLDPFYMLVPAPQDRGKLLRSLQGCGLVVSSPDEIGAGLFPLGVFGSSKLSETIAYSTTSSSHLLGNKSQRPAVYHTCTPRRRPFPQAPRLFMQTTRPSMVHPGTQGNHHIRDVSLRPISLRPSSICGSATTGAAPFSRCGCLIR